MTRIGILPQKRATPEWGRPVVAEGVGFEPTEHCCSRVLQTRAFLHSAILPNDRMHYTTSGGIVQTL